MTYAPDLVATARAAFGHGTLVAPDRTAHAANPLCGDEIDVDICVAGSRITALAHRTRGCTFTLASASLLAQATRGMTLDEALDLAQRVRQDLPGHATLPPVVGMLAAVRVYPARIRCALLPWDALIGALREV